MSSVVPEKREPGTLSWWWSKPWRSAALLVAAVVLCYWNSLSAPFLFDDDGAVVKNPTIRNLASLEVLNPPANGSTTTNRPVVNLSFAINHALNGERVWGYHALNVAIHALAALALLGIVRRTLMEPVLPVGAQTCCALGEGRSKPAPLQSDAMPFALLIALLWALHPLQTETVVCIAQRTESLCALFYLLTLTVSSAPCNREGRGVGACWQAMSGAHYRRSPASRLLHPRMGNPLTHGVGSASPSSPASSAWVPRR